MGRYRRSCSAGPSSWWCGPGRWRRWPRRLRAISRSNVLPPRGYGVEVWQAAAAVGALAVVTTVNVLGTAWGGRLQVAGTVLKVGGVLALLGLPFVLGGHDAANLAPVWPREVRDLVAAGDDGRHGRRALGV